MELPGGGGVWLAPSPSPSGPAVPDRHDEHGVDTFIWPKTDTSTWPPAGTFSWPRTRVARGHRGDPARCLLAAVPHPLRDQSDGRHTQEFMAMGADPVALGLRPTGL